MPPASRRCQREALIDPAGDPAGHQFHGPPQARQPQGATVRAIAVRTGAIDHEQGVGRVVAQLDLIANQVAQRLVIPAQRDGAQAQLVARPMPDDDDNRVARLMDWLRENLRAAHSIDAMEARTAMGPRTLFRKFKERTGMTPLAWLVRERVSLARVLLETRPGMGIDDVADLAGLGSAASLRRHFRIAGMGAPGRYRKDRSGRGADVVADQNGDRHAVPAPGSADVAA